MVFLMTEYYSYIFVRQDMSEEQQLIQFGHVSCVLGWQIAKDHPHINPSFLNFVGIGVSNEKELLKAMFRMQDNQCLAGHFIEPNMNDSLTAIASIPVKGEIREIFRKYDTLKFSR